MRAVAKMTSAFNIWVYPALDNCPKLCGSWTGDLWRAKWNEIVFIGNFFNAVTILVHISCLVFKHALHKKCFTLHDKPKTLDLNSSFPLIFFSSFWNVKCAYKYWYKLHIQYQCPYYGWETIRAFYMCYQLAMHWH